MGHDDPDPGPAKDRNLPFIDAATMVASNSEESIRIPQEIKSGGAVLLSTTPPLSYLTRVLILSPKPESLRCETISWELLSEIHILPMLLSSEYNRTFYWAFWVGHDDPAPGPVNERNPSLAGDALFFTAADRGWRYSHRFFDTVVFSLRAPGEQDRQGHVSLWSGIDQDLTRWY